MNKKVQFMEKRQSNWALFISYSLSQFCVFFVNPYLSLDTLKTTSPRLGLFIVILIWIAPFFAQATTMYLFSGIAEKKRKVKVLIILGYSINFIQFCALYFVNRYTNNALLVLLVTGVCNLFIVAYIPAIKTYLSSYNKDHRNKGKSLSMISMVESLSWALGILAGGILYDLVPLFNIIIIAICLSASSIMLIPFLPSMDPTEGANVKYSMEGNLEEINPPYQSVLSFKEALVYQLLLLVMATSFYGLLPAYLQFLNMPSWFYGMTNAIPGVLAVFMFYAFGRILDKFGPNTLYHFGWILYLIVYIGLLSGNIFLIFIVWILPVYTFRIATEFLASHQKDKSQAIRNMSLAGFVNIGGIVLGNLFGGTLTLFSVQKAIQFRIVLIVSLVGIFCVGISLIIIHIIRRKKNLKANS